MCISGILLCCIGFQISSHRILGRIYKHSVIYLVLFSKQRCKCKPEKSCPNGYHSVGIPNVGNFAVSILFGEELKLFGMDCAGVVVSSKDPLGRWKGGERVLVLGETLGLGGPGA